MRYRTRDAPPPRALDHASPAPTRRSATAARRARALAALALAHLACAPAAEAPTSPTRDDADADAAASAALRTANDDRCLSDNQPDYEGEAVGLRAYVDARLGEIKADEPAAACTRMLDAAAAFYAAVEREEAQRSALLAALSATREGDHEACVRETSSRPPPAWSSSWGSQRRAPVAARPMQPRLPAALSPPRRCCASFRASSSGVVAVTAPRR